MLATAETPPAAQTPETAENASNSGTSTTAEMQAL